MGAEIFGTDSLASEVELLDVLFTLLDSTDVIARSHIDIGHVAIFQQLCQLASVPMHLQEKLIELYANKALPELKLLTSKMSQFGELANDFYVLGEAGNNLQKLMNDSQLKPNTMLSLPKPCLIWLIWWVILKTTGMPMSVSMSQDWDITIIQALSLMCTADESLPLIRGGRFSNHFHHEVDNTDAVRSGVGFSCELKPLAKSYPSTWAAFYRGAL